MDRYFAVVRNGRGGFSVMFDPSHAIPTDIVRRIKDEILSLDPLIAKVGGEIITADSIQDATAST